MLQALLTQRMMSHVILANIFPCFAAIESLLFTVWPALVELFVGQLLVLVTQP
jgi:hypothetical protein